MPKSRRLIFIPSSRVNLHVLVMRVLLETPTLLHELFVMPGLVNERAGCL